MRAATRVGWRDPTSTGYYCRTKHSGKYTYFVRARNQTNKEGLSRIRTRLVLNKRRALRYSTPMASDFSSSESQGRHRRGRRSKSRRGWGTFLRAALRTLPLTIRLGVVAALLVVFGAGVNWAYHAAHKPTEVFLRWTRRWTNAPLKPGGSTARCSANMPPPSSRRSCWRRWPRWKARVIP